MTQLPSIRLPKPRPLTTEFNLRPCAVTRLSAKPALAAKWLLLIPGVLACQSAPVHQSPSKLEASLSVSSAITRNFNAPYSEDAEVAERLERALQAFLAAAEEGEIPSEWVIPGHLDRYAFYFHSLARARPTETTVLNPPSLLKSFEIDDGAYLLTVAFSGMRDRAPFLRKIVEFKAVPDREGYRFGCPFEENTRALQTETIGSVTYRFSEALDRAKAKNFVAFKEDLERWTNVPGTPLEYYCFEGLDALLKAYGFVFDATKCNFLRHDLGFADSEGRIFVTGTGREDYKFGYIDEHLYYNVPNKDELYGAFVTGMGAYFGGWALTGETVEELKAQFRAKLAETPDFDFLAEFKKGRGSSVNRHPCFYVMSAFLCQEVIETQGFQAALPLLYSGSKGERFFEALEETLGVSESEFHETIARLIEA